MLLKRKMALTRKEIDARRRAKCKEERICPACGKKKDREGYYCSVCNKKNNERKKKDREYFRKNHICVMCGKERVYGEQKTCFTCREKGRISRSKYTDEQKEKYKKIALKHQKEYYKECVANGFCTQCKKRKADEGKRKCRLCLDKDAERKRMERINYQNVRENRKENHLCYFCGGVIEEPGKNVCNACSIKMAEYSAKAQKNRYWKTQNNLVFRNN